jgi:hypothetical protein
MKDPVTKSNKNGNLVWCNKPIGHVPRVIFFVFLLLPFVIAYPNGWIKVAAIACALGTWLWNYSNPAFGSRWCWASNSFSLLVLLLVLFGLK